MSVMRGAAGELTMTATMKARQLTTQNRSIELDGDMFVYRRFGTAPTDVPALLCLQHFRGNPDRWDPAALVDRLAQGRQVILLDNRGVGGSTGTVPDHVTDMARVALAFTDALGLKQVDLLVFSIGGYIAQEMALLRPRLIRRVVLAATARKAIPTYTAGPTRSTRLATADVPSAGPILNCFSGSEESRAKGMEYFGRANRPGDAQRAHRRGHADAPARSHHGVGHPRDA